MDIDIGEIAAVVAALGAVAATLSNDSSGDGGSTRPIFEIPANFGQGSGSNDSNDDDTNSAPNDDPNDPDDWTPPDAENNPNETRQVDREDEIWDGPYVTDPTPDDGGSDDYEYGGPTGGNQSGTGDDRGDDDPAAGASPGDTSTGGTGIGTSEALIDYDDVAGVGDHLAGSTDEWVGGLW